MAEALGVASSVLAIVTAAIQSVQFLYKTIDDIKGAPDAVKNIGGDLKAVEPILRQLNTALTNGNPQVVLSDEIKCAVENCDRACTAFQTLLAHWMRHSTQEKAFWVDRWRVGLFGQDRIKAFNGRLNDCKATLSIALSTATIITTTNQEYIMKDMKDMMLKNNETILQQEIARAGGQRTEIESTLQQISVRDSAQQDEESEQSKQDLLQEIRQQQAANDAFRKTCEEALSRTVYERRGLKIKGVKATNHSSVLTGFINTSGEESRIDQDISDVVADNWSVAVAGVVKNFDFKDLRPTNPSN
ncbi:hypothetical protein B7463_g3375, partial [Scytalidium lignicola]